MIVWSRTLARLTAFYRLLEFRRKLPHNGRSDSFVAQTCTRDDSAAKRGNGDGNDFAA